MAESVDARDLKSLGGNSIRVQFPFPALGEAGTFVSAFLISWASVINSYIKNLTTPILWFNIILEKNLKKRGYTLC